MIRRVAALAGAAAAVACAQPSSPPGGAQDRVAPRVVSVFPAPFDTLEDLRAPVSIEFDERLSITLQGVQEWSDAVLVSPITGDVRVEHGRRSIEVSIAGGWRRGVVYSVVVLPVFSDLFGNLRQEPVELLFTTGAPIPATAIAGFVEDRITGMPVPGARVEAIGRTDGLVHVAVADTSGFFALRSVPAGEYDVRAWLDRDRDLEIDFQEPRADAPLPLGPQDTVVLQMALLPMDTMPARLLRAEALDSVRVRLVFDDYFAPGDLAGAVDLYRLPDSVPVAVAGLIHPVTLDSILARERAIADSLQAVADSLRGLAPDTLIGERAEAAPPDVAVEDPAEARVPAPARRRTAPAAGAVRRSDSTGPLPSQELILVVVDPLRPQTTYVVEARGLVNIRGVPGGGGTTTFTTQAADTTSAPAGPSPPPVDPAAPDSLPPPGPGS